MSKHKNSIDDRVLDVAQIVVNAVVGLGDTDQQVEALVRAFEALRLEPDGVLVERRFAERMGWVEADDYDEESFWDEDDSEDDWQLDAKLRGEG